ncbi:MAG TPA: PEP-CTERM sorting domain-containing protein [Chthoniobacteraceae bacterium]|jgi:hypothetical protein
MQKFFLCALLAMAVSSPAQAQFAYDFNTSQEDVNAKFTSTGDISNNWQAAGGVGDTGRLAGEPGAILGTFWKTGYSTLSTADSSVFLAVSFQARVGESSGAGSAGNVAVGISDTSTGSTFQSGSNTFFSLNLNGAANNQSLLQIQYRDASGSTGGTQTAASSGALTLANNEWYQLRATFNRVDAGSLSITNASLWSLGVDGTATPTALGSTLSSGNITNLNTLENASSVFYGFAMGQLNGGGAKAIDNFSAIAVPEPSSAILGLCGIGLLFGFRRARQLASLR